MRKADYSILSETIKRHGNDRVDSMDYPTRAEQDAARKCAERIARTFARFASVDKTEFLKACGLKSTN